MRSFSAMVVLLLAAACGHGSGTQSEPDVRSIERATVTDVPGGDGPVLCTGPVAESAPPQCKGPVIADWDWSQVWGAHGEEGAQWGEFCLSGRDSGDEFMLAGRPRPVGTCGKQEYTASATVLENQQHGPQLCLGGIGLSLPIRCGGLDIPNWSWDRVEGQNTAGKSTDGAYQLHGVYEDSTFTVTRPPKSPGPPGEDGAERSFKTPCPEPEGGWFPAGRKRLAEGTVDIAATFAGTLPGYSEAWLDQSNNPSTMNDPNRIILNVRVTTGRAAAEKAMRSVWSGALCVSAAEHTDAELRRIQDTVGKSAGALMLTSSAGDDHVDVQVIVDVADKLQRSFDREYGKGLVRVSSALRTTA